MPATDAPSSSLNWHVKLRYAVNHRWKYFMNSKQSMMIHCLDNRLRENLRIVLDLE